jgi:hypothetical protein
MARIKPFLLSKARCIISKIIEPHHDKVKHIHTDGFITTENIDFPMMGNVMGKLKFEKFGQCKIVNSISVLDENGEKF